MLRSDKLFWFLKLIFSISIFVFNTHIETKAQLFQQNFNSGPLTPSTIVWTGTTGYAANPSTYVNSLTPDSSQFTSIGVNGSGNSCTITIIPDALGGGRYQIYRSGATTQSYTYRKANFPGSPTTLLLRFDFEVLDNTAGNSSAFFFYVGSNFSAYPNNHTLTTSEYHSRVRLGINSSGSKQWNAEGVTPWVTGSHTVLMAVNNSGSTMNYFSPNGTCESVGDDKYDVWIDATRYADELSASNPSLSLSNFLIGTNNTGSTVSVDNILIDPIPPTPVSAAYTPLTGTTGSGFVANWTPVSGVTGYNIDVSTDPSFTTVLSTTYVAGASSSSYAYSALTSGVTYYYRIRGASIYAAGTYQSCSSTSQVAVAGDALSFTTQPSSFSICLGNTTSLSVSSSTATTYQWFSNTTNSNTGGTALTAPGPTNTTFAVPTSVAGTYYYYCVITRGLTVLASNVAVVNVVSVPTLSSIAQASPVCGGVATTINMTGMVPGSINTVFYRIAGGPVQSATNVVAAAGGTASFSFTTTNGNNGQVLVIDSIRSSCTSTFATISTTLVVNQSPSNPTGGTTVNSCSAGTLTLSVSNPGSPFSTNWYTDSTGGSPIATNTNSYTTPSFSNDTTVFYFAQTYSPTTGCFSPTRVRVTGVLIIPDFVLANSTIYSPPGVTTTTINIPYTFVTPGLTNFEIVWTSANASGFATTTTGVIPASSPISYNLGVLAAAGTYTGTIKVKNASCFTGLIPFTLVVIPVVAGDLGSVASGLWATNTTWRQYQTSTGRFDGANATPSSTTNCWIIDGYTVTLPSSGSCKDLHVLNGRLLSGTNVSNSVSVGISGSVIEVANGGNIGNGLADNSSDGISFNIANITAPTFSGSISGTTLTVTSVGTGTSLQAGQIITGGSPAIIQGTVITAQLSGTPGGAGNYSINNSQNVTSATLSAPLNTIIKGIGGTIDISRLIISRTGGTVIVDHDMTINYHGGVATTNSTITGSISGNILTTTANAGTILIGQTITGTGIAANTIITGFGTGTSSSSSGTYFVNISQNVTSTAISASYPANQGLSPALYPNLTNTAFTINAGRTVTLSRWANVCLSSNPLNNQAFVFTMNINGNLNFAPGIPTGSSGSQIGYPTKNGYLVMNTSTVSGIVNPFTINIGSGGSINAVELYTAGMYANATATNLIKISSGGILNIDSIADFRKSTQTVTGGGTFNLRGRALMRIGSPDGLTLSPTASGHIQCTNRNFSKTAVYSYESKNANQVIGNALDTVGALIVADTNSTLTLSKDIVASDSLRFNGGKLVAGTFNITTNAVRNFRDTNYVVTGSTGALRIRNVGFADVVFPVGPTVTSYNPVTLSNSGTTDNYAVRAVNSAIPGMNSIPRSDSTLNKCWSIVEDVAGGSNMTVTPQWNGADTAALFNKQSCSVIHSNGTVIDYAGAIGPVTGTGPFSKLGFGFTSFAAADRFGVGSTNKKYRSKQSGFWSEFDSWEISNPAGGYSPSEADFPNTLSDEVAIQPIHSISVLAGTTTNCGNLTLGGTLNLSTQSGDVFNIGGSWSKSSTGLLNANDRPVVFTGTADATITAINGQKFDRLYLQKSALANKLTLNDSISIAKELKVTSGTLDLAAKNITLLSDPTFTACFAAFPPSGAAVNYSSTGRFVVQRYIHTGTSGTRHAKTWQLLAAPVDPAEGVSIKQSWMENAGANLNPNPGFGTQVVGPGGVTNGFDVATAAASIKSYDTTTQLWQFVTNTNQNVANDKGYMIFVRGSRAIITPSAAADSTTLRVKGKLRTGSITGPVVPVNNFQSVANPYASSVDFNTLTKTNLQDFIWVFDPSLNTGNLGGYNVIDPSGTPSALTSLYANPALNRILQSGQAFFVRSSSTTNTGSITFKETDKITESHLVMRENQLNAATLRTSLQAQLTDGTYQLCDGNLVVMDDAFSNDDEDDALKFFNNAENWSVIRSGKPYAIEKRKLFANRDTVFYDMLTSRTGNYRIDLNLANWNASVTTVLLHDKYLNVLQPVNITGQTIYDFQITNDPASKASDRFMIVFNRSTQTTLPVDFISLSAKYENSTDVRVKWEVGHEQNISKYDILRSQDGVRFQSVGQQTNISNNGQPQSYLFTDANNIDATSFYKIAAHGIDASIKYSPVVLLKRTAVKPEISVYPNPITNGYISINMSGLSGQLYHYKIINALGQLMDQGDIDTRINNNNYIYKVQPMLAPGIYTLRIEGNDGVTHNIQLQRK